MTAECDDRVARPARSATSTSADDVDVAAVVRAAAAGDRQAWELLVDRYVGLLWSIALRHGIGEADAADVVQSTWMRLLEHIDDLREPHHVGAWLATTARREALRTVALRRRVTPHGDDTAFEAVDIAATAVDEGLLDRELAAEARAAVKTLPPAWQQMLELLVGEPALSYQDVSERLGMPLGSIGPTRQRCVGRLRAALEAS